MALSPTEESLVRQLIAQNPALLNLASSESTIMSKLGATKVSLSDLSAATSLSDADLALVRQGLNDKSFAMSVLLDYVKNKLGGIVPYMTYAQVSALSSDIGPVSVVDRGGFIWQWVDTAFFTGYRSPLCGKLDFGWTPTPLPWQVEGIGGTLNEDDHGGLIARFRESGLTVALGSWVAGEYKIADMGGGEWKAPDMRNQFLRFTGTDADTANARLLGSKQGDASEQITGTWPTNGTAPSGGVSGAFYHQVSGSTVSAAADIADGTGLITFDSSRVARTSDETRPQNTAFLPFITL